MEKSMPGKEWKVQRVGKWKKWKSMAAARNRHTLFTFSNEKSEGIEKSEIVEKWKSENSEKSMASGENEKSARLT